MKLWEKVKVLEDESKKDTSKLPEHDRTKFFWLRLPKKSAKHEICFSMLHAMKSILRRYSKLFGIYYTWSETGFGEKGKKSHGISLTIKVYFNNSGGM